MGDSRIRVDIHMSICDESKQATSFDEFHTQIILLPADSSLRDLIGEIEKVVGKEGGALHNSLISGLIVLLDCTFHPPKDLLYDASNNQRQGFHSVTLQSLGWFPSGTLSIFPAQYGETREFFMTSALTNSELGTFQDAQRITTERLITQDKTHVLPPSQVLAAVEKRFDNNQDDQVRAKRVPSLAIKTRQRELERCAKLDVILHKLNSCNSTNDKQARITSQVRQMLIKSRSKGEPRLDLEDRFYLHVAVVTEEQQSTLEHKYFSRVATIGKVTMSCVSSTKADMQEFLVKRSDNEDQSRYWRLPNTLPLHEAEKLGFLRQFEQVIVRNIGANSESIELTPSILDRMVSHHDHDAGQIIEHESEPAKKAQICNTNLHNENGPSEADLKKGALIRNAIEEYLSLQSNSNKKVKPSKTSDKVRQMLIKSKAKGDSKRVAMPDRFFLEVICMKDSESVLSSSHHFFSLSKDSILSVRDACCPNTDVDVLVRREAGNDAIYESIPLCATLKVITESQQLNNFDQIILMPKGP